MWRRVHGAIFGLHTVHDLAAAPHRVPGEGVCSVAALRPSAIATPLSSNQGACWQFDEGEASLIGGYGRRGDMVA